MAIQKRKGRNQRERRRENGKVESKKISGYLRLVIPKKHSPTGKEKRMSLGLRDTPEDWAKAKKVDKIINLYIGAEKYDPSKLDDYIAEGLGKSSAEEAILVSSRSPQLDVLWNDFVEFKKDIVKESTLICTYIPIIPAINKLSTKSLLDAKIICRELKGQTTYPRYYWMLTIISACCDRAVRTRKIEHNPFREYYEAAKPPNSDEAPDPFSKKAMELIIDAYRQHHTYHEYADYVEFKFLTGCRPGEGVALKWKNVDFQEETICFCESITYCAGKPIFSEETKTGKPRKFPFKNFPRLKALLKRLYSASPSPTDFVFQNPQNGSHINYLRFYYSWHGQKQRGGHTKGLVYKLVELGEENGGIDHYRPPYNTRHTFITLAVERWSHLKQFDLRDVAQLADYVGNTPGIIFEHYLGRSGNTSLVNISGDASVSDALPSHHESSFSHQELQANLALANQKISELTRQLTEVSSRSQPLLPTYTSTREEVVSNACSVLPSCKKLVRVKTSQQKQPSVADLKQLTLFSALAESIAE